MDLKKQLKKFQANIGRRLRHTTQMQKIVAVATTAGAILFLYSLFYLQNTDVFQTALIVSLLVAGLPYTILRYLKYRRTRIIEKYLPDYLRDVSEGLRAGMALPRAIESASKGSYGPLSDEMQKTAAQISWGVPFTEAMEKFANRSNSALVDRSVTIIVESHRSGGNVAEVLETVARDIKTIQSLRSKRKSKLRVYLVSIYFIFFLFLGIIASLTVSFVPATPDLNKAAGVLGGTPSDMSPADFRNYFFHLALVEAFFAGLIGGQMGTGHVLAGFKHSVIMIVSTLILFQVILAPPGFVDSVAGEIVKLPPNTKGMSSSTATLTISNSVNASEIAKKAREKAEAEGKGGYSQLRGSDIIFLPMSCSPCSKGDLLVTGNSIEVKKSSDVPVKVRGKGDGEFEVIIGEGAREAGGESGAGAIGGGT